MFQILPVDDHQWLSWINEVPEAMIFHHPAWIKNLTDCYGYKTALAVVKDAHGRIRAGLPLAEVQSFLTGKRMISLPFSDFCAPLYSTETELEELLDGMQTLQKEMDLPWEVRAALPARTGVTRVEEYVVHSAPLEADPEVVFNRINRKVRKYIRSSINRGVSVESGTSQEFLRKFYHHQLSTRRRHGLPAQPWKYFSLLGRNLLEKGLGEVYLAFADGVCLAGLVVLHWGKTLTLKYGASDEGRLRELRPNHQLDWTAIQWGCANEYTLLDVGRSDISQEGLRDYKNRWGYEERPLAYAWLGTPPPLGQEEGKLAGIFHAGMRLAPLWACQATGDILYKHFP